MILTPTQYAKQFYGGSITGATVRNWIKGNKLPGDHKAEQTPTGHYIIRIEEQATSKSKAQSLVELMKSKGASKYNWDMHFSRCLRYKANQLKEQSQ